MACSETCFISYLWLLIEICATKHTQTLSCMLVELDHQFRYKANELHNPTVLNFPFVSFCTAAISCIKITLVQYRKTKTNEIDVTTSI